MGKGNDITLQVGDKHTIQTLHKNPFKRKTRNVEIVSILDGYVKYKIIAQNYNMIYFKSCSIDKFKKMIEND